MLGKPGLKCKCEYTRSFSDLTDLRAHLFYDLSFDDITVYSIAFYWFNHIMSQKHETYIKAIEP